MKFEYLEVRPCIEAADASGEKFVESYVSENDYRAAILAANDSGAPYETFWTVYGRYNDGDGAFLAEAIADRATKELAHQLMNAILAPMAAARDLIDDNVDIESDKGAFVTGPERASALLADFINQSSNEERV